jgi:signal transduction histidine kinase
MELNDQLWSVREVEKLLNLVDRQSQVLLDVLDSIPLAIGIMDGDFNLTSYNKAFAGVLATNQLDPRLFSILAVELATSQQLTKRLLSGKPIQTSLPSRAGYGLQVNFVRLKGRADQVLATIVDSEIPGEQDDGKSGSVSLANVPDPVYAYNPDGRIVFVNRAFVQATGFSEPELLARRVEDMIEPLNGTVTSRIGDFTVRSSSVLINTRQRGKLTAYISEPDRKPEDQSNIIAVARLAAGPVDNAASMSALEQFAGQVAHRFNNLLTIILSSADLVSKRFGSVESLTRDVGYVKEAGNTAAELTSQLLTFSQGRPGQAGRLKVNEGLRSAQPAIEQILGDRVAFTFLVEDMDEVTINLGDFETILVNLATNAQEAISADGKVSIYAFAGLPEHDQEHRAYDFRGNAGQVVTIGVQDTGSGIPPATLDHIFEPFCSTKGGRPGLGLSVVYGIVKKARGRISINSTVDHGTTIWVSLRTVD